MVSIHRSASPSQLEPIEQWMFDRIGRFPEEAQTLLNKAHLLVKQGLASASEQELPILINDIEGVGDLVLETITDEVAQAATWLIPLRLSGLIERQEIETVLNRDVSQLVSGVAQLSEIPDWLEWHAHREQNADALEALRETLMVMVDDVRVVLIKIASRAHELQMLRHQPSHERTAMARETLAIYSPLSNRLGLWHLKWILEDYAFRFLEPERYRAIAKQLQMRRGEREAYIQLVINTLKSRLSSVGVEATFYGRAKHIYSIWRKMQRKSISFDEIYDVSAIRVLVDSVKDCYTVLGVVHELWPHIPKEFDDYIANPKPNGYRSLHTAVRGPDNGKLEVQIRTFEMDKHAEHGIAAHWQYKEGGRFDKNLENKIRWFRTLLNKDFKEEYFDELIEEFAQETSHERVYLLSENGELFSLPEGSTPVDFAYAQGTDIGHRCRGARVNGKLVALDTQLRSGDQVEVILAKSGGPSRDWLDPELHFLTSSRARATVRSWFRRQNREKNIDAGRFLLEREISRLGLEGWNFQNIATLYQLASEDELFAAIGRGEISCGQLATLVARSGAVWSAVVQSQMPSTRSKIEPLDDYEILGGGGLPKHFALCCKPVPEQPIVGFITRQHELSVHRANCTHAIRHIEDAPERLVSVSWMRRQDEPMEKVSLWVRAYDRQGLLFEITSIINAEQVNVVAVNTRSYADGLADLHLTLEAHGLQQTSRIINRINTLPNVVEARSQWEKDAE